VKKVKFPHDEGDKITATFNTYSGQVDWTVSSGKKKTTVSYHHKEIFAMSDNVEWYFTIVLSNGQKVELLNKE
jgi:hypothetical protein